MIGDVSIVVLTPVKNEEWVMDKFLRITSLFADYILVADQFSNDSTVSIINSHPKAVYIKNENSEYDEEFRQRLLISKARELITGKRLLLALDADELITADSIESAEWNKISKLPAGTRLYFKKPDLLPDGKTYVDYPDYFLLGYIDDGATHAGTKFHSPRLPASDKKYESETIQFLHLALIRDLEYNARQRLYAVLENINQSSSLRFRYRKYARKMLALRYKGLVKPLPEQWVGTFRESGIEITKFPSSENNIYNSRIIEMFNEYGTRKFWFDDIWYVDYIEISRITGKQLNVQVNYPPVYISFFRKLAISLYAGILQLKKINGQKDTK